VAALSTAELEPLIAPATFHERKALQIRSIALQVGRDFGGLLPCDRAVMEGFAGVGPKCASLALGIACGHPTVPVDIHVHRVANRWGYIATKTPEHSMVALEAKLPMAYRPSINKLLLPFGKYICTGVRPKCSTCPVLEWCAQVGVTSHR
jgi:endonuclease-3